MAKEYIEREAALRPFVIDKQGNRIHEIDIDNWLISIPIRQVKRLLREVPAADVVEVVRCKDCKHSTSCEEIIRCLNPYGLTVCDKNDFCSFGERRDNNADD